jgi:hypothetical protein
MSHRAMGALPTPAQISSMIALIDWWHADRPVFEGQRCLQDAACANSIEASAHAVARIFVLQAAAAAVRERTVGPRYAAAAYVAALFAIDDPECGILWECLAAIRCHDLTILGARMHDAARLCAARGATQTARNFAELSYEAALASGAWEYARGAALILERLAEMEECPRAAEEWARRAVRYRRGRRRVNCLRV